MNLIVFQWVLEFDKSGVELPPSGNSDWG